VGSKTESILSLLPASCCLLRTFLEMNVAIIAAAGQGKRMGGKRAKQFLEIAGIPVIIHTLKRFEQCADIDNIVVVLPENEIKRFKLLLKTHPVRKDLSVVAGGPTRTESVERGLEAADWKGRPEIVAIHDGVRPFVTPEEISCVVSAARLHGAAILAAPVTDTIKLVREKIVERTVPRANLRRALTPQCFHYDLLSRAFARRKRRSASAGEITDESMLIEKAMPKVKPVIVEGHARNIKITRPEDLALAEILLKDFRKKGPRAKV
jgi:2-C-methyl-D-erythritol 4-phosphate cytidylyltransferase